MSTAGELRIEDERPRALPPRRSGGLLRIVVTSEEPLEGLGLAALLSRAESVEAVYVPRLEQASRTAVRVGAQALLWHAEYLDRDTLARLRQVWQPAGCVGCCLLTSGLDPGALRELVLFGVDRLAVLLRGNRPGPREVVHTLAQLAAGEATISPRVLEQLVSCSAMPSHALRSLSPAERDVLELMSLGLRNGEIARRLQKSEKLVERQVGRIFAKLDLAPDAATGVDRRVAAVRMFLLRREPLTAALAS
jgi:DNA-binding NarL/FixJ family response regulator